MSGDTRDLFFHSGIQIDKILGTFEDSFISTHPTGVLPNRASDAIPTNIPESTFFQGIYSVDGGTTWQDFNMPIYSGASEELVVFGISNANTFTVRGDNSSFSNLTDFTIMYKVALIAKPDQGDITPQPIGADIVFDSRQNYQKIFYDEPVSLSIPNATNHTEPYNHNLTYVPKVRSFIEIASSYGSDSPAGLYETAYLAGQAFSVGAAFDASTDATSGIYMNTSNVYVTLNNQTGRGNFTGTLYTRIYYDE